VPRTFQWKQDSSFENGQTNEKLMVKVSPSNSVKVEEATGIEFVQQMLLISRYPSGAAKQWIKQNEKEVLDWGLAYQNRQIEF
jgi:hypothetical protein